MSSLLARAEYEAQSALTQKYLGAGFSSVLNKYIPPTTTNATYQYLTTGGTRMKKFFFQDIPSLTKAPFTPFKVMIWSFIILAIVGLAIYLKMVVLKAREGFENNYSTLYRLINTLKSDETESPNLNTSLLNLQPLTFKQTAFLGPDYNSFDIMEGLNAQLQLGTRCLMLQIDYVDRDRKGLCKKFEPCLYYKSESGTLISSNSVSLTDVFKHIGETAFNPLIKNSSAPLIILLHFVNLPSQPNEYLGKVANALQVLQPKILTGGFYRSQKEDELFTLKFSNFASQIIIGTNVSTSSVANIDKNDDLDYMVHFHYYVPENVKVDSTVLAPYKSKLNSLIFDYKTVKSMTPQQFTQKYSSYFTIMKTPQTHNIQPSEMKMFLDDYGINVIPYEYFKDYSENSILISKIIKKLYSSCFKTKKETLMQ